MRRPSFEDRTPEPFQTPSASPDRWDWQESRRFQREFFTAGEQKLFKKLWGQSSGGGECSCRFLVSVGRLLGEEVDLEEIRLVSGPITYVVLTPERNEYSRGRSRVAYIGFTEAPVDRFRDHDKVEPGDVLRFASLQRLLRAEKDVDKVSWKAMSKQGKWNLAQRAERALLFVFEHLMGEKPIRNTKPEPLSRDERFLVRLFLDSAGH